MYCRNCGYKNEDNDRFCIKCGQELGTIVDENIDIRNKEKKNNKPEIKIRQILSWVLIIILVTGSLIFLIAIISGRSEKKVVNSLVKGMMTCNMETVLSVFPEELIDAMEDEGINREYLKIELQNELEDQISRILTVNQLEISDAVEWRYSYKMKDIEKTAPSLLIDIQDEYMYNYNVDVSDAETVETELNIRGEESETFNLEIGLIKVGHKWYLDAARMVEYHY